MRPHQRYLSLAAVVAAMSASTAGAQGTAPRLTLREALATARAHSPARQASAARLEAAQESRQWAGRLPNPTLEGRWENWASGHRATLPLDVFATVTQPVELGGKRAARTALATAGVDSARAALVATARDLDGEIVRRYVGVVGERDRGRVFSEQARELGELVRVLERRVAEGVSAEADLRKLEGERARVELDAALAHMRSTRDLASLAALVGWTPTPPLDALDRPAIDSMGLQDVESRLATAIDQRVDVQLAKARLQTAEHLLRFEQARAVPDLQITGGLKRTSGYDTGVLSVTMPVPVFDRNRAALALARGHVTAATLELSQTQRLAEGEIRSTVGAARELVDRQRQADARLVVPATIVKTAARAAFASGAGDLLRLVDAERVYTDARLVVDGLALEVVLAVSDLRLALAEEVLP